MQPTKGTFPFPLNEAPGRSRYLTWIRNRSSYLTVGGIGNVFASLASFAWGIFKNLTCLLPVYLLVGLVLGWLHFVLLENWLLAVFVISVCFTCVATYLDWMQAKVTDPASREVSDVESRMEWARIGGWLLFGVVIGVFIILVPRAVELVREFWRGGLWSGTGIISSIGGAIAAITGLQKFLPKSEGSFKRLASVVLTFAAIVLLTFALIAVCDFVVYGNPLAVLCHYVTECSIGELWLYLGTLAASVLLIAACLGLRYRGMGQADIAFGVLISVIPLAVLVALALPKNQSFHQQFNALTQSVGKLTRPLSLLVSKPVAVSDLPGEYLGLVPRLRTQSDGLTNFYSLKPKSEKPGAFVHTDWATRYFDMAQTFAMDGQKLIEPDALRLANLRANFCRIDRRGLVQLAQQQIGGSTEGGIVLSASMQGRCRDFVAALTLQRLLNEEHEQTSRFVALPLLEALSDESLDVAVELLRKQYPSAGEEDQFALLTGREDELVKTELARRNTLAALASIPILGPSTPSPELRNMLRRAILRHRLSDSSERERVSAASAAGGLPGGFSQIIEEELFRAQSIATLENATLAELAVHASGTLPESVKAGSPELARDVILNLALNPDHKRHAWAMNQLSLITEPPIPDDENLQQAEAIRIYQTRLASLFSADELIAIALSRFAARADDITRIAASDSAVMNVAASKYGDFSKLDSIREELSRQTLPVKLRLFLWLAGVIGTLCFVAININATSIHGVYRDRLSSTFLLRDLNGRVVPENSIRMSETCQPGSTSPYPIINVAVNMQSSADLSLRDRHSDCFVFTKCFSGGSRTGYVETIELEAARPELRLNTAMAISAAAASPNMGRMTSSFTTLLMTLLNVRLGYWIPNPRFLTPRPSSFEAVFKTELKSQVVPRWNATYMEPESSFRGSPRDVPSCSNGLFGLAFSGGGIRSASLNIGIAQVLDHCGLFRHFDYLSSVSGGGYTASAITTLMRFGSCETSLVDSTNVSEKELARKRESGSLRGFLKSQNQIWRLPHLNLGREMISSLHEDQNWVNVSDGGHIENLATIELLRRRCKFIVVGDGEADPEHTFNGVATLIEFAALELNAKIELPLDDLKIPKDAEQGKERISKLHYAIGIVKYMDEEDENNRTGSILYLKSSLTGDESEVVKGYASAHKSFPHEPTSDQFFDIMQFEAYRQLGVHIARSAMLALLSAEQGLDPNDANAPDDQSIENQFRDFSLACRTFERLSDGKIRQRRNRKSKHTDSA
jgi:hypothetical protein